EGEKAARTGEKERAQRGKEMETGKNAIKAGENGGKCDKRRSHRCGSRNQAALLGFRGVCA
ncbi:unnamed protein product, partial [Amoebophrya sp. A120]